MLKMAIAVTTSEELNKLIHEGNYKYLNFSSYVNYNMVELGDSDWNNITRVSTTEDGRILGLFNASISQADCSISSCLFVKFRHNFKDEVKDEEIADKDFKEYIDSIMNHPILTRVKFMAIKDNPANKTYEEFMEKYKGERFLLSNYIKLQDGKLYDTYVYWFDRTEVK